MRTIVCVGTGPSLRREQLDVARARGWPLYVCNDAIRWAPDAALLTACNTEWWDLRWPDVCNLPCEKWTTRREAADRYGLNWIDEVNRPALSTDPAVLHHGHSSGYQLLGLAYRAGAGRIVLLGYDLSFAADYDGKARALAASRGTFLVSIPRGCSTGRACRCVTESTSGCWTCTAAWHSRGWWRS